MSEHDPYKSPAQISSGDPSSRMGIMSLLFSFRGRIPRRTYWLGTLAPAVIFVLIIMGLGALTGEFNEQPATGSALSLEDGGASSATPDEGGDLFAMVVLILLVPMIWIRYAVQAKRWHDRDKSGWMCLINIAPLLGIWTFIECGCTGGTMGSNQHGPDPT